MSHNIKHPLQSPMRAANLLVYQKRAKVHTQKGRYLNPFFVSQQFVPINVHVLGHAGGEVLSNRWSLPMNFRWLVRFSLAPLEIQQSFLAWLKANIGVSLNNGTIRIQHLISHVKHHLPIQHLVTAFPLDYVRVEKMSEWRIINPGKLTDELINLIKKEIGEFEVNRLSTHIM